MRFSASQSSLLAGMQPLTAVLPTKSPMPVLTRLLAQLQGNTLSLTATDLEISMETRIEVKGSGDGRALFPARKVIELVRDFPDVVIVVEASETGGMKLKDENGKVYDLAGETVQNYPKVPEMGSGGSFSFERTKLRRMIGKTGFAVSRDELRPQLTGMYFKLMTGSLELVTTDGHRLVKMKRTDVNYEGETRECIVPAKAMNAVQRICEGEGTVEIAFAGNQLGFRVGETTLLTKLIEGRYPNYEAVIPTDNKNLLTLDLEQIHAALRRAATVSNEISRQIRLTIKQDRVDLRVEDIEQGNEGEESVPCNYTGEPMEIGYNAAYVLDVLKQVDTSEVVFELGTATSAAVVRPSEQEEHENLLMLVMPVRLA